jgi:RNA polymerase sigma factor (sigma-70 family)
VLVLVSSRVPPSPPNSTGDPLGELARLVASERTNQDAARTLLRAVTPGLLRVVRGVLGAQHPDVPDVCQEAALALLKALKDFRSECTVLHFACRVGILTAVNARRRARMTRHASVVEDEFFDSAPGPAETADAARRRAVLRSLLDELPPAQAEVLALHVMLGYTVTETAAAVAAPLDTVRSRLRRALAALRERINNDGVLLEVVRGGS